MMQDFSRINVPDHIFFPYRRRNRKTNDKMCLYPGDKSELEAKHFSAEIVLQLQIMNTQTDY